MIRRWIRGVVNWAYNEEMLGPDGVEVTCLCQPPQPGVAEVVHIHMDSLTEEEQRMFRDNGFMTGTEECLLPQYPLMSKEEVLSYAGGDQTPR